MPKVPKRELSYGEVLAKKRKLDYSRPRRGTNDFPTYEVKEPRKGSKHGAVKTRKLSKKEQAARKDYGHHLNRLRQIMNEEL